MRKSVFFKFALIIIPIFLLLEIAQIHLSYRTVYDATLETYKNTIQKVGDITADNFRYYNEEDPQDKSMYSTHFDTYCEMFNLTYIFAVKPDIKTRSEEYLAIGFGKDASDEAKKTRYPGVVVNGTLTDEEISVYNGEKDYVIVHEQTMFDDSLICYYSVNELYNYSEHKMEKLDEPLIIGTEIVFSSVIAGARNRFYATAVYGLIFTFVLIAAIFAILYFRINGPIKRISKRMKNFISDRDKGFEKLEVKGKDELAEMSASFNSMAEEIDTYIKDIDLLTREKHTQDAELEIARNIQMGLLMPSEYCNDNVRVNAYMMAAKNVGGDYYDYRLLDNGMMYFAIADVSGKGISAALFMSRAITLLHQYALLGYSPAKMLSSYNDTLAEQNPNGLFITTFAALYNPVTKELTYSNAGHNIPYVISDTLIPLDGAQSMAAGIFKGEDYSEQTVKLKPNDVLFLYTDGVNEAENNRGEFFGTEALEKELERCIGKTYEKNISNSVLNAVEAFSEGAEQNDDITVLTVYLEPEHITRTIKLSAVSENLPQIERLIEDETLLPDSLKPELLVIAEEIFVNICSYAYADSKGDAEIELKIFPGKVDIIFKDEGTPFDPTKDTLNIDEYDHDNSIGGLGRFLAFELADDYSYSYSDGKNILTIVRNFEQNG